MNYEQQYKEALARAKEWMAGKYSHYVSDTPQEISEFIFPELKESSDEKIRKEIIKLVKFLYGSSLACEHTISKDKMLAWLEKQGNNADKVKQQQAIEIPFGAKDSELQEATYYIPDGYHAEINGNEVSIKKGEQKTTWKPTEEQIEALEHLLETIRRHEYSYFHEEKFLLLHSLLEQLKEL